jgi:DNA-binding GntR family transcriptional regulator
VPNTESRGKFPAIEDQLRAEIAKTADGGASEQVRLGSETELAARFKVARNTVRAALSRLADDGLIYSVPARGWFIGDKADETGTADPASAIAALRGELLNGDFPAAAKFATAPEVAKRFNISLHAARQVLIALGAQGLIESKHGKGWFVR